MKIAILSRNRNLYSTKRLVEAAEAGGIASRCGHIALLYEHHLSPAHDSLPG